MSAQPQLGPDERLEIVSRFHRFGDTYGYVTELAQEWGVSRSFVYTLAGRARKAVAPRPAGRPRTDTRDDELERLRQRVRELEADLATALGTVDAERQWRAERQFRLLMELALAPVSEAKIARCLEAAFERAPSVGWINEQINRAGAAALKLMRSAAVCERVEEAAIDEIFAGPKPILMLVEPRTLMLLVPEAAGDRTGRTWHAVLERYPKLGLAISDQGSGLTKGVGMLERGVEHQTDLFHLKREVRRELRRLETGCYAAIERVEEAKRRVSAPRLLVTARGVAEVEYRRAAEELDLQLEAFDWLETIVAYLEEWVEPYDARRQRLRDEASAQRAVDEVLDLLDEIHHIKVAGVRTIIEGARSRLFTFLRILERRLGGIEMRWAKIDGSREAVIEAVARVWYWRGRAGRSERDLRRYLAALGGLEYWDRRLENLGEVIDGVFEALGGVVRASSAVESINSILRPYSSVKKHLNQKYLALVALYWNMRGVENRSGRTPFEAAGVDLGTDDWVELIEVQLRRMARAAAATN